MAVKVTADASGYTAELDRARKSALAFQQTQAQAAERVRVAQEAIAQAATNGSNASAKAINNFVSQLQRTADTAGKTRAELLQMKAAQMGISESVSNYINRISEASKQTHSFGLGTTAARRELMVLAHEASQGSWKRFGGSLMVLGEQMDATRLIMNPFTLGLVAVGGAAAVMYKQIEAANARVAAYHDAMNSTAGFAGQTRETIQGLAEVLSGQFGVGVGAATDDLNKMVASGRVSADVFPQMATVATAMAKTTGDAFDKVLEGLLKQQEDVKKAAEAYQASHHTMTDAQMSLIDSLEKTGQKHAAFAVLIQQEQDDIERSTKTNTSKMIGYWDEVTASWQRYTRALSGNSTDLDTLNDLKAKQAAQQSGRTANYDYTDYGPLIAAQQKIVDGNNADQAAADRNNRTKVLLAESQAEVAKQFERTLSPQQRLTEALQRDNEIINNRITLMRQAGTYTTAAQAQLEAQRKQMLAYDTEHITPSKKHGNGSAIAAMNAETQTGLAIRQEIERQSEQRLQAQRALGVVDAQAYYTKLTELQRSALDDQIALAQRRADAFKSAPGAKAYKEAAASLEKLQIQRNGLDASLKDTLAQLDQKSDVDMRRYQFGLGQGVQQQAQGFQYQDNTQYMTQQQKANYDRMYQIQQQYMQRVQQLAVTYALDPASDQKEYALKIQYQQAAIEQMLQDEQKRQEQQAAMRKSYTAQMRDALHDLGGDAMTNAQLAAAAFTSAWQDSASALEQFVTTGKGSFSQFTASVLADLARIALHQAEIGVFNAIGTSFFSAGGPVGHFADGGAISGAGTGTSDSIPAMLSNGEYVINAASTKKYRSLLDSINHGGMAHFANGGAVGVASGGTSGSSTGGSPVSITINNHGGGGLTDQDAKDLHAMVSAFVDKRMGQAMRGQGGYAYQMRYGQI
ncbi:phage tail length tape measure family protein [Paraburkholderia agricolaris]|uniref:Phage tail length tape measure family protein n=1 Tax=Paraburkholderia agricolaris TaxID=2152888 RepID=A0ABW8ZFR5_9BURK